MNPVDGNKPLAVANFPPSAPDSQFLRPNLALTGTATLAQETGATAASSSPSMSALLGALRRRWTIAVPLAVLAGGLAVFLVLLALPVRYTVQAAVQIHSNVDRPLLSTLYDGEGDFAIIKGNQAALIKSSLVLLAALTRVKDQDLQMVREQPNPVKWLETAIKTDFLLAPEVLRITLSGDDAQEITALANAIIDAHLDENRRKEDERRRFKLDLLEANRQKTENIMRAKRATLRKIEETRGLDDLETTKQNYLVALQNLSTIKKDLSTAEIELVTGEEELRALQEKEKLIPTLRVSDFQVDRELEKMPQGKLYYEQINLHLAEIGQIEATAKQGTADALIESKKAQVETLRKQVRELHRAEVERKVRGDMLELTRDEAIKAQAKINTAKKKSEILTAAVKTADDEVRRNNPNSRRWPADVEALRDEVLRLETALTKLGETIAVLLVEPPTSSRVSPWQRAEVPSAKDMSRQVKFGGAAGLGAFCLLLFGVGYIELRAGRVSTAAEVQRALGMSVVGTLPPVPQRSRRGLRGSRDVAADWQHQLVEAVDSIRTMLLHAARSEEMHVVMITSAVGGEGKTSLASQLAASLARSWRKTLLIDSDLRNPGCHKLFELPQEPGFSEVLRGEASPVDVIRPTSLSRLWVMPAGQWDDHAVQALAQDNVRTIFDVVKQQYDFVIVDSSPVLPVADALSLGQHVDGVIFSVLRDVSRIPALQAAQQRLASLGVRMLGAVVIGTQSEGACRTYTMAK